MKKDNNEKEIKQLSIRIPDDLNTKWRITLLENKKTAQEVLLKIIEDIVKGDKELLNKYLK